MPRKIKSGYFVLVVSRDQHDGKLRVKVERKRRMGPRTAGCYQFHATMLVIDVVSAGNYICDENRASSLARSFVADPDQFVIDFGE